MRGNLKIQRILAGFGLAVVLAVGWIQLSAQVQADPPLDNCAAVLCFPCPAGTVAAPTPGNCCRCKKV
jgi:hypothetical protein